MCNLAPKYVVKILYKDVNVNGEVHYVYTYVFINVVYKVHTSVYNIVVNRYVCVLYKSITY